MRACEGAIDVAFGLHGPGLSLGSDQLLGAHAAGQSQQTLDQQAGIVVGTWSMLGRQ